jgi:hypothetical protein
VYIHRLIAIAFIPNPENKDCDDHIDNNRTNNKMNNIRWASQQENQRNRTTQINNTSGTKGIVFDKTNNKWRAQITIDRKFSI